MKEFTNYLMNRLYKPFEIPELYIEDAFFLTKLDYKYHFPEITEENIRNLITKSGEALPVFLYRLGSSIYKSNLSNKDDILSGLHWLMKEICSMEIYFNNTMDQGLLIVHGEGTVIGSRNTIGKGFIIHQGCTIGHKKNGMGKLSGNGCKIGDNVRIYVNSTLIGELLIGSNVTIGAHTLVMKDVPDNTVIFMKN